VRKLRFIVPSAIAAAAIAVFASVAVAQSPHFIGTPSCTKSLTTGLTCSGKASGLGNEPAFVFLTADSVTANYECVNKGGNVAPPASPSSPRL
jgi:hypothetical protein